MPDADPEALEDVRLLLARGQASQALGVALSAARRAGVVVLDDRHDLPPAERLALALQAADEVLEGLAVELAGGGQAGNTNGKE